MALVSPRKKRTRARVAEADRVEAGLGLHAAATRAPEENEAEENQLKTPDPFFAAGRSTPVLGKDEAEPALAPAYPSGPV